MFRLKLEPPSCQETILLINLCPVISGFRRHVDEICAPQGYGAASSGKFPTYVSGHVGPIFNVQEVH